MRVAQSIKAKLRSLSDKKQAAILQRFFKTGPGEYGEGDKFLGIKVPIIRKTVKPFLENITLNDIDELLHSDIHEERFAALAALVDRYQQAKTAGERKRIFDYYIEHIPYINNWDLVDVSAPHIVGHYLFDKEKDILFTLAKDSLLWRRRVAVLATFYFIRQNQFQYTIKLAKQLLNDKQDLIHKAVGWMLREIGKRDKKIAVNFLDKYHAKMPRIMLSYAIERFEPELKQKYRKK